MTTQDADDVARANEIVGRLPDSMLRARLVDAYTRLNRVDRHDEASRRRIAELTAGLVRVRRHAERDGLAEIADAAAAHLSPGGAPKPPAPPPVNHDHGGRRNAVPDASEGEPR